MSRPGRTALAARAPVTPAPAVRALVAAGAPPALWFVHLNVCYLLVPPSCRWGHGWGFVAATVVALAGMGVATRHSWRVWREAGETVEGRSLLGLLGLVGVTFAALFSLTTVLVGISSALVGPCQ